MLILFFVYFNFSQKPLLNPAWVSFESRAILQQFRSDLVTVLFKSRVFLENSKSNPETWKTNLENNQMTINKWNASQENKIVNEMYVSLSWKQGHFEHALICKAYRGVDIRSIQIFIKIFNCICMNLINRQGIQYLNFIMITLEKQLSIHICTMMFLILRKLANVQISFKLKL